jgi:hypothetical protein
MTASEQQATELKKLLEDMTVMLSECHALDSAAEHYGEEGCTVCDTLEKARQTTATLFA